MHHQENDGLALERFAHHKNVIPATKSLQSECKNKGNGERTQHSLRWGERERNLVHLHCLTLILKCYFNTSVKYKFTEQPKLEGTSKDHLVQAFMGTGA